MSSAWEREWSRKSNRPTYKDRHARNSSWPGELISTKGRIHLRRLAFLSSALPCSRAADHTFSSKWIGPGLSTNRQLTPAGYRIRKYSAQAALERGIVS